MPTRAGCKSCDWKETFSEHSEAKNAAIVHDCGREATVGSKTWVKDVE